MPRLTLNTDVALHPQTSLMTFPLRTRVEMYTRSVKVHGITDEELDISLFCKRTIGWIKEKSRFTAGKGVAY